MALTTCKDCGNQISTRATFCPRCGRPDLFMLAMKILLALAFASFLLANACSDLLRLESSAR